MFSSDTRSRLFFNLPLNRNNPNNHNRSFDTKRILYQLIDTGWDWPRPAWTSSSPKLPSLTTRVKRCMRSVFHGSSYAAEALTSRLHSHNKTNKRLQNAQTANLNAPSSVSHWGPEVRKDQFQFTERSFAVCNTYNCHRQHYLQTNSKSVRTSGGDHFTLHNSKLAFCNLESSRIIAYQPHLNCTQLQNCHT